MIWGCWAGQERVGSVSCSLPHRGVHHPAEKTTHKREQQYSTGRAAVGRDVQGIMGTKRQEEFIQPGRHEGRLPGSGQWLLNCI